MAKKENNNIGLGEITTIRDILMGQQMTEYEERFHLLEKRVDTLEAHFDQRLNDLEQAFNARTEAMEKAMSDRFDKLEQLVADNTTNINEKIAKVSKDDQARLGRMLAKVSEQLMDE